MGMAAILVMWPRPFENFRSPILWRYEIWLQQAQWFLRRCLKSVDDRRRTMEAYLSYKLTKWAFGSGEIKMWTTDNGWTTDGWQSYLSYNLTSEPLA